MDNFKFRFHSILTTKEKIEEQRKSQLGYAIQNLKKEQESLEGLIHKQSTIIDEWQDKFKSPVKVQDLRKLSSNMEIMRMLINNQKEKVQICEFETEKTRNELVKATKERKVFEKLKEKDYEEYKYILHKKEEAFVDQFVSYKAANR